MFILIIASLAHADDVSKSPCLLRLGEPTATCAADDHCIVIENTLPTLAVSPIIGDVCGPGKVATVGFDGEMQGILDPRYSTPEHPVYLPLLAPEGSPFPSKGTLTLPKFGPMTDGVREALNDFVVTAQVWSGTFGKVFDFFIRPGHKVKVFDDDPMIDITEHGFLGTCVKQKIQVGIHKRLRFGGSCSGPELAKSRR